MWADILITSEVDATLRAADALSKADWAAPLLATVRPILEKIKLGKEDLAARQANPVTAGDRGFLFEIRYAQALAAAGLKANYEYSAGVNGTTIDFKVDAGLSWLIELVSLRESQAVKDAMWTDGIFSGLSLTTTAADPKQSEEGEILKAQERIAAKCWDNGSKRPVKFPVPNEAIHMLMVDARGYLGTGQGDICDWHHIALGARGLPEFAIRFWTDPRNNQRSPIAGLFEPSCPLAASAAVRERIHIIGFVCENTFEQGEIAEETILCGNPFLINSNEVGENIIASWPLMKKGSRTAK